MRKKRIEKEDKKRTVCREELLNCPNSKGHWELISFHDGSRSRWNVLYNSNWPLSGSGGWIATNGIKTCMCSSLPGKWRKISNNYQPGLDICDERIYQNIRIKKGTIERDDHNPAGGQTWGYMIS